MMREEPGDRPPGHVRQAVGIVRVVERVGAVPAPERQVHVHPAAAAIVERPSEERREPAVPGGDLADEHAEQEGLVRARDRVAIAPVHLEGGAVELAAPALHVEPRGERGGHHVVHGAARVDRHPGAVDAMRREVRGRPRAVLGALAEVELELERDLRLQVHLPPRADGLLQHVPRVDLEGVPVLRDVGDADDGVVLPPRPQGVPVQLRLDVGQADVELLARDRQDLLVRRERVHADAERRVTRLRDVAEEVLPALETQDVRDEQPQPPAAQVHRLRRLSSRVAPGPYPMRGRSAREASISRASERGPPGTPSRRRRPSRSPLRTRSAERPRPRGPARRPRR